MSEKQIQQQIFKALGGRFDVRLFRNNVGTAWMGHVSRITRRTHLVLEAGDVVIRDARRVVFGLHKGSSDLIGFQTVTITPEMVGQQIARFVAIEVKAPRGRLDPMQENFLRVVTESGGAGGVARSPADALQIIGGGNGGSHGADG